MSASRPTLLAEIIRQRRSIKPALMDPERPIDPPILAALWDAARWAPTHGLTQPWRFHVFAGPAREALAEALPRIYRQTVPPDLQRPEKLEKLSRNPLRAPVVTAVVLHRDPSGRIPEVEEVAAVACAVQNLHLTASARGLGAFWSSPPLVYSPEMHRFLDLDEGERCLGLLYLGWPAGPAPEAAPRNDAERFVIWKTPGEPAGQGDSSAAASR